MKEKTNVIISVVLILIVLACFAIVYKTSSKGLIITGADQSGIPKISATGDATLEVMPDEAEIRISMETKAKTAKAAQDENSKTMSTVQGALKQAGIAEDNIESVRYNIYPIRQWNPKTQRQEDSGFRAEHVIKITTNELDKVGTFIQVAVDAGANSVEGVNFTLSKELKSQVRTKALKQACQSAKEKAQAIADGLGVGLGDLLSVSESSFGWSPIRRSFAREEIAMIATTPPPIEPEQVTVTAKVNVSYRIM